MNRTKTAQTMNTKRGRMRLVRRKPEAQRVARKSKSKYRRIKEVAHEQQPTQD